MKKIIIPVMLIVFFVLVASFILLQNKKASPTAEVLPTPTPLAKIKLGYYSNSVTRAFVLIAEKKGFFKKNNIDIKTQGIDTALPTALVSKQINVALQSPTAFITAKANGADIFEIGELTNDFPFLMIAYKTASNIKTIGVPRIGGESYLRAIQMLKKLNVEVGSITFKTTGGGPSMLEALRAGQVDAVIEPSLDWSIIKGQKLLNPEPKIVYDTTSDKSLRNPTVVMVDGDLLKKDVKTLESLSKALIQTNNWIISAADDELSGILEDGGIKKEQAIAMVKDYKSTLGGWKFRPEKEVVREIAGTIEEIENKKFDVDSFVLEKIADSIQREDFK